MSANNYLLIEKVGDKYYVNNVDADGGGGFRVRDEGFNSLKEATKFAQDNLTYVEYGIEFDKSALE